MASITIRNVDAETVAAVRRDAAARGQTLAAESRLMCERLSISGKTAIQEIPSLLWENNARRVADLLSRVGLTPPADFAEQLRSASGEAEAEDLVADQVQRFVNAVRAEARAEKTAQGDDAGSRGG